MDPVTPADIDLWSQVDFPSLGFETDAKLQVLIDRAIEDVMNITGRTLEGMPTTLDATAGLAIQLRVEQLAYQAQPDYVETLADFDLLASFSAGPYSEQRRGLGEAMEAKVLSSNPTLHGVLFGLLTDDKRDDYLAFLSGEPRPWLTFAEITPSADATL